MTEQKYPPHMRALALAHALIETLYQSVQEEDGSHPLLQPENVVGAVLMDFSHIAYEHPEAFAAFAREVIAAMGWDDEEMEAADAHRRAMLARILAGGEGLDEAIVDLQQQVADALDQVADALDN